MDGAADRCASADEESEEHGDEARDRDQGTDLRLAAEHLHRDLGAGPAAAVADPAAPGVVAGDVLLLCLELLVAGPWAAGAAVADRHQGDPADPQHDVDRAHPGQPSPAPGNRSSCSRMAASASAAFAWPRVAFMTWPTKKPITGLPARKSATARGLAAITSATIGASAPASEICLNPLASTIAATVAPLARCSASTSLALARDNSPEPTRRSRSASSDASALPTRPRAVRVASSLAARP